MKKKKINIKVDAVKLLKIEKLPKILFLQLNRFEYDFITDTRKKLYDRFTFPNILNFNEFLNNYENIKKIYDIEKLKDLERRDSLEDQEGNFLNKLLIFIIIICIF